MSSANRERRQRNRDAKVAAIEDAHRRAVRQRVTLAAIGIALAVVVAVVLVARATGNHGSAASATTTTIATTTSTTLPPKPKRCVAMKTPPKGTPVVPVTVGPPPKKLVTRDITVGTGAVVEAGSTVTVDYVGVLCTTGKTFGTSYGSQPLTASLASLIPGWEQGIVGMRVGGVRVLGMPASLGYGATGTPDGTVPPDAPLWFLVKLDNAETATTTTTTATATTATTTQPAS